MKAVLALLLAGSNAIVLKSDPMFSSLGYETRHYKGEGDCKNDYDFCGTVPNFGRDSDIIATLKNAAYAEKVHNHVYDGSTPDPPKRNYFVPHFGTDKDILDTATSISAAEVIQDHKWTWKSQHLLDHLKNPVPPGLNPARARLDDDMITTGKNADDAEKSTGQHWTGDGQYA